MSKLFAGPPGPVWWVSVVAALRLCDKPLTERDAYEFAAAEEARHVLADARDFGVSTVSLDWHLQPGKHRRAYDIGVYDRLRELICVEEQETGVRVYLGRDRFESCVWNDIGFETAQRAVEELVVPAYEQEIREWWDT